VRHAGTAVGIAVAFSAPIGGLLFAFEELANSFSQALGWQIFFACMIAVRARGARRATAAPPRCACLAMRRAGRSASRA